MALSGSLVRLRVELTCGQLDTLAIALCESVLMVRVLFLGVDSRAKRIPPISGVVEDIVPQGLHIDAVVEAPSQTAAQPAICLHEPSEPSVKTCLGSEEGDAGGVHISG